MPKLGIKIYNKHCKDLGISLLQNSGEHEVLWIHVSRMEFHCFPHLLESALLGYLPLGSVLGQPLAMLNTEAVAEYHSSSHPPQPCWIIYRALRERFDWKPDFRNKKGTGYLTQHLADFLWQLQVQLSLQLRLSIYRFFLDFEEGKKNLNPCVFLTALPGPFFLF